MALTWHLEKAAKYNDIKKVVKQASQGQLKSILGHTKDQVVSRSFNNDAHSSVLDAGTSVAINDNFTKLISWYDSEYGYSNRWWTSWPTWPSRSQKPWTTPSRNNKRRRERLLAAGEREEQTVKSIFVVSAYMISALNT